MSDIADGLVPALRYCVDLARLMLAENGSFMPFGAVIAADGAVNAVAGWDGEEHPRAAELLEMLADEFRDDADDGMILGAALAVDVNMPPALDSAWPDGIRVRVEEAGYARLVYVPYRIGSKGWIRRRRHVWLGKPVIVPTEPEIFPPAR
ncbi:MAG TPA: hypothetical protein VN222_05705 [Novosphingobium sp.]|nr:hypothetical protein [Novosphingobium sp.]